MSVFSLTNITLENKEFRKVLVTEPGHQLVVMSLEPNSDIGLEVHKKTTQFIKIEKGSAVVTINEKKYTLGKGDSVTIPPNTPHNVKNMSSSRLLKLYTIYSNSVHH